MICVLNLSQCVPTHSGSINRRTRIIQSSFRCFTSFSMTSLQLFRRFTSFSMTSLLKMQFITMIAAASLACITCGHAEEVIDSICGMVDDEIILESEVSYGVHTLLLESGEQYPTPEKMAELRHSVLEAYIVQKILIARAAEETLTVEDRVVNRELDRKLKRLIQQVGSEGKLVEYFGRPLRQIKRELREGVREGLLSEMLKSRHLAHVQVRRSEVIEFYREHSDEMPKLPERVILSHILLEVKPSAEAERAARERIENIYDLLKAGADFDSVARQYSEDPSAGNAGRLGFTERNDLVPEYEEVAYQLEPGEISGIVESRYGLHIIKLLERQGERISTQHILIKLTPTQQDWDKVRTLAAQLKERIESGDDFAEIAGKYSADGETAANGGLLEPIATRDLPVEFRDAVDTISEGETAAPFESDYGVHLIRLNERLPARKVNLTDDWQTIEQFALMQKRERLFQEWIESLKKEHYIMPSGM